MWLIIFFVVISLSIILLIIFNLKNNTDNRSSFLSIPNNCKLYYNNVSNLIQTISDTSLRNTILATAKKIIVSNYKTYKAHKGQSDENIYMDCIEFIENSSNSNVCKLWANIIVYNNTNNINHDISLGNNYIGNENDYKQFLNLREQIKQYLFEVGHNPDGYPKTMIDLIDINN